MARVGIDKEGAEDVDEEEEVGVGVGVDEGEEDVVGDVDVGAVGVVVGGAILSSASFTCCSHPSAKRW